MRFPWGTGAWATGGQNQQRTQQQPRPVVSITDERGNTTHHEIPRQTSSSNLLKPHGNTHEVETLINKATTAIDNITYTYDNGKKFREDRKENLKIIVRRAIEFHAGNLQGHYHGWDGHEHRNHRNSERNGIADINNHVNVVIPVPDTVEMKRPARYPANTNAAEFRPTHPNAPVFHGEYKFDNDSLQGMSYFRARPSITLSTTTANVISSPPDYSQHPSLPAQPAIIHNPSSFPNNHHLAINTITSTPHHDLPTSYNDRRVDINNHIDDQPVIQVPHFYSSPHHQIITTQGVVIGIFSA